MPESIPLRTRLRIESQDIVIHRSGRLVVDFLLECYAIERRYLEPVKGPVQGDSLAINNLFGCGDCRLWGEEVEHAQLVVGAKKAPRVPVGPVFLEWERFEGWP